jgi:uncharacterized membrane protein HdeD (DUF308 family)
LGILTIILAEIALSFPRAAAIVIIAFPGAALLFDGFAIILEGITNRNIRGWVRGFIFGVGVLNVLISIMILGSPIFGVFLIGIIIGYSLFIVGIQMITAGITERPQRIDSRPTLGP